MAGWSKTQRRLMERAIAIAAEAHAGHVDKAGAPYILHPLRVMMNLATPEERMAGVLHDVIEDTKVVTIDDLRKAGFPEDVLSAVQSLTALMDETYDEYLLRVAENPIGRNVKLADLVDNADLSRIASPTPYDIMRTEKYLQAIDKLQANPERSGLPRGGKSL